MPRVTCQMTMSVDGFVAGPDQSEQDPMGVGALRVHDWHRRAEERGNTVDLAWRDSLLGTRGAYVMGRNMFGPVRGEWSTRPDWRGWWGEEPPYHAPVFVLTHHEHEPIGMAGGTTFHFVTGGISAAIAMAKEAAGELDVDIAGGASTVRQALRVRAIDVLVLDIAPVVLGRGESLFAGVEAVRLTPVEAATSDLATHVRYDVSYDVSHG